MRRWHAIPVAVLTALAVGVGLFGAAPPVTEAGGTPDTSYDLAIDCTPGGAIQLPPCTPTGTVNIVFSNDTASAVTVGAFQFDVISNPEPQADPTGPPTLDGALSGAGLNCSLGAAADNDPDPQVADSVLICFLNAGGSGVAVPAGGSVVLAQLTYSGPGPANLTLTFATVADISLNDIITQCTDVATGGDACFPSSIVPTATAPAGTTNTPVVPTACPTTSTSTTPVCPTNTPQNFVTVTPTETPGTPTVPVPGEEPPPPGEQPPGGGQQPGGGTAPGGGRPGGIRLPDTGSGDASSIDWSTAWLMGLLALGAGGLAGGAYLAAVRRPRGTAGSARDER